MQVHAHLILARSLDEAGLPEHLLTPRLDVHHMIVDQVGIDDARTLVTLAACRPIEDSVRSFVVCASTLTNEAQNALLKLFEEPPLACEFYVIVPHESAIIPTLRSRLVASMSASPVCENEDVATFLAQSYAERLSFIAALAKEKSRSRMEALATALAAYALDEKTIPQSGRSALAFVEPYMHVKGGSKKMLLEHLALSLPVAE